MEKSKYYTPTIEEFHVGFEYEVQANDDSTEFEKLTITKTKSSFEFMNRYALNNVDIDVRVKYLDKEDIESLGFESLDVRFSKLIEPDRLRGITRTEVYISKLGEYHYKIIKFNHYKNSGGETILFSGIIKNKSAFKVLLKQLNIK